MWFWISCMGWDLSLILSEMVVWRHRVYVADSKLSCWNVWTQRWTFDIQALHEFLSYFEIFICKEFFVLSIAVFVPTWNILLTEASFYGFFSQMIYQELNKAVVVIWESEKFYLKHQGVAKSRCIPNFTLAPLINF